MILSSTFIVLAGIFKAFMDASSEGNLQYLGDKYNKSKTWKNKWKLDNNDNLIPNEKGHWWYFKLYKPQYVERFPFSSTLLVGFTDFWHNVQNLFLIYLIIGVYIFDSNTYKYLLRFLSEDISTKNLEFLNVIYILIIFLVPFTIVHNKIKQKNNKKLKGLK